MATTPRSARIVSGLPLSDVQKAAIAATGAVLLLDDAAQDEVLAARTVAEQRADVWFGPGLSPRVLNSGKDLAWFQTSSVGIEYFMHPALLTSSVTVTNMRAKHTATSEHAFALMLALARGLPRLIDDQRAHRWGRLEVADAVRLYGSELVVVGTGQIGAGIARRARAFEMAVTGINRSGTPVDGFDRVRPVSELVDVVAGADWLVNAVPYTRESGGLFSADLFAAVKPGCLFVNIGRGRTVDQDALVEALRERRLGGAGLDVFAEEPLPEASPLWDLPNVVVTPHAAGVIPQTEVTQLAVECLVANLDGYQRDGSLADPVDKERGY